MIPDKPFHEIDHCILRKVARVATVGDFTPTEWLRCQALIEQGYVHIAGSHAKKYSETKDSQVRPTAKGLEYAKKLRKRSLDF